MVGSLPVQTLLQQGVLRLTGGLYLALAAAAVLWPAWAEDWPAGRFVTPVLAVVIATLGIHHGLRRHESVTGRLFWHYVSTALVLLLASEIFGILLDSAVEIESRVALTLWADFLNVTAYLVLTLAAEIRPDLGPAVRPREREEMLLSFAAVAFLLTLFCYLTVIPAAMAPAAVVDGRSSILLRLCLGIFLVTRFAVLTRNSSAQRWREVYRLLAAGLVGCVALQGLTLVPLIKNRLFWLLPLFMVVLAARLGHVLEIGETRRERGPRAWEPLVFYTIALPFLHLLLSFLDQLPDGSRKYQEGMVVLYFICFGALALGHGAWHDRRRRRAEAGLRESEYRYRRLIESHPDLILIEQDGNLVYANTAAREKLGLDECHMFADTGFPAAPIGLVDPEDDTQKLDYPIESKVSGKDETLDLEISYYGITFDGLQATQLLAHDVTEAKRRRADAERTERLATLGKISAAMAHEIRNPLAAIVLHCFFLADRLSEDEENLQILADINTAVQRMQKLVNGILSFVRPSDLRPIEEDVVDVLESSLASLSRQVDDSKVDIAREYCHQNALLDLDVNQMMEVFTQIFDNAVRSMPDGGRITIYTDNPTPDKLRVVIEDTGVGMEEDLEKVFEPFYTRRDDGLGLGLALAARILDQHACRYHVESDSGGGFRFVLAFRLGRKLSVPRNDDL